MSAHERSLSSTALESDPEGNLIYETPLELVCVIRHLRERVSHEIEKRVKDVREAQLAAEMFVEERHQDQKRYTATMRASLHRYEDALRRIAGEDYRGNRPQSATIAWKALNPDD